MPAIPGIQTSLLPVVGQATRLLAVVDVGGGNFETVQIPVAQAQGVAIGGQTLVNMPLGPNRDFATGGVSTPLISARSSIYLYATSALDNGLEFVDARMLDVTKGAGATGSGRAKVLCFMSTYTYAGGGDAYTLNLNTTVEKSVGSFHGISLESDFNNGNRHYGDTAFGGLAADDVYGTSWYVNGLAATDGGGNLYRMTAMGVFNLNGIAPNRGFLFGPPNNMANPFGGFFHSVIARAVWDDMCDSAIGLSIGGTKSISGIDMSSATFATGMAMRIRLLQGIAWHDSGSGLDHLFLSSDASNNFLLGSGAASIIHQVSAKPVTDNALTLGTGALAYSDVFSHHYTTVSDADRKKDFADLPTCTPILMSIKPTTYRYKGGHVLRQVTKEVEIHEHEETSYDRRKISFRDGRYIEDGVEQVKISRPVIDMHPVTDADGQAAFSVVPAKPDATTKDGRLVKGHPEAKIPAMHHVPKKVRAEREVWDLVPEEDKTVHWGFTYQEVEQAFKKAGVEFGGLVTSEDGGKGLREFQMIPILWKVAQELNERLIKLEKRK